MIGSSIAGGHQVAVGKYSQRGSLVKAGVAVLRHMREYFGVMALVTLALATPVGAQQIDPAVLQRLQGQLGAGTQPLQPQMSPLDQARQRDVGANTTAVLADDGGPTPAERTLRDMEAQKKIVEAYEPSAVERYYQSRAAETNLRQFCYDLFSAVTTTDGALVGRVGDDYVVGVGDELVVSFQGSTSRSLTVRVDREGRLIVDQLPPVPAAGRRLGEVRRSLEDATRRTLLGTDVYLSVGSVRAISVVVGGEVEKPGQYTLTSLADVMTALGRAGGVKPSGSLRQVRVSRGGAMLTVDLYGLLGIGGVPTVRLQDGDRIIVPAVGRTMAIVGAVARPAIFELPAGSSAPTLAQALAMAGGTLRPSGNDFTVQRIDGDGREHALQLKGMSSALQAGDILIVAPRERGVSGRVFLDGFVDSPGPRALAAAPSVKVLLGSPQNMKFGSYLPMAVLIRRDEVTNAQVYTGLNLFDIFHNDQDVPLRSEDRLVVLGAPHIAFLQSVDVRRIVLGQPNPKPQCRSLLALEALVQDSQSDRFSAAVRGSFLMDSGDSVQVSGAAVTQRGQAIIGADPNQMAARSGTIEGVAATIATPLDVEDVCPELFEKETGVLPFLLENLVVAGGNVRRPGVYPLWGVIPAATLARVAEGLTGRADRISIDLTNADPYGRSTRQTSIEGTLDTLMAVQVASGDDVRFNSVQPQFEAGAVLLSGEFARPGLYTIRKGEKLSELMARAGGLTEHAYPYGAVFTRRSVKLAQQEGFRRTARELNAALLSMSARKNVTGDSLAAATQLAQGFATVDAPGRMVVEADPRVLALKPDVDTVLDAGDAIFMPKRPNFVLSLGDVLNPGALQFEASKGVDDYLREAGGIQRTADEDRVFLVYPNGVAKPIKVSGWLRRGNIVVPPGSTIVVPKDVDPLYTLDVVKDVATIIGQFATSIAAIAVIASNN